VWAPATPAPRREPGQPRVLAPVKTSVPTRRTAEVTASAKLRHGWRRRYRRLGDGQRSSPTNTMWHVGSRAGGYAPSRRSYARRGGGDRVRITVASNRTDRTDAVRSAEQGTGQVKSATATLRLPRRPPLAFGSPTVGSTQRWPSGAVTQQRNGRGAVSSFGVGSPVCVLAEHNTCARASRAGGCCTVQGRDVRTRSRRRRELAPGQCT